MMLRIYIHDEVPVTSIVVEGKLVGPWVNELEKCWETVVVAHPAQVHAGGPDARHFH